MTRFCIYTTGRTGSTAITDELNRHPQITCHGEVMRINPTYDNNPNGRPSPVAAVAKARAAGTVAIYKTFTGEPTGDPVSEQGFVQYLDYLEAEAGTPSVGWKVITRTTADGYLQWCRSNDVRILNLQRKNVLRKVISGLVAQHTGHYNLRNFRPKSDLQITVDPRDVVKRMRRSLRGNNRQISNLQNAGVEHIAICYEDWISDRTAFYASICEFLDVDSVIPEQTDFSVMTPKSLTDLIANYGALAELLFREKLERFLD